MSKVSIKVSFLSSSSSYITFIENLLHIKHSSKHSVFITFFLILTKTLCGSQLHKECAILVSDINNRGHHAFVIALGVWKISGPSSQFCCELFFKK